MNNKELLHRLNGLFAIVSELRVEVAKNIAVKELSDLLNDLEANSEIYEIWIGYYSDNSFELDKLLNSDSINAMMDIKSETLIDFLLNYYDNNETNYYMPSQPTVAIKIRVDNESMDTYYIEYDGYDLDFDLG
jgi:hypothetical protein